MISLYRGELHKVSGVPRQWIVPKSQISVSTFRKALKKRNAALNKLVQPAPVPKTDGSASPVANGTGEASNLASDGDSGDLDKRGGSENDEDNKSDRKPENGGGSLDGRSAESTDLSEGHEVESKRKQERKRRREDDLVDGREGSAKRDGLLEEISRGESKVLQDTSEPMIIDGEEQPVAMDCDFSPGKAVIDSDGSSAQQVRVRVLGVGSLSESESKLGNGELVIRGAGESKQKDVASTRRNGELPHLESTGTVRVQLPPIQNVTTVADKNGEAEPTGVRVMDEDLKRREELEAKLEKLRAEKHRFVLRLKQVLNEEDVKKRSAVSTGSPGSLQGAGAGAVAHVDKNAAGGSRPSADLEDGELEYARTPSPPLRATPSIHGSQSGNNTLGPPPVAPVSGRQTSLSQHLSQSTAGRGGYYVPGLGLPPSPGAPGVTGGALSPGAGFIGNLPSSLGSHSYSHNLAMQHAAAIYAQKVTSATHGHGQFTSISPGGAPGGTGPGVSGGPPGFSGFPMSSSVHSHHSHLAQSASSSLPHVAGQQGVSPSLLTTPRGPPAYHDMRLGGSTWIQR